MRHVVTLVLGGGRGTRLYPLTKYRAKPAVPVAGKYRLIDIPLSNCINSGLNHVYVLTQFLSVSLHRHLRESYRFDVFSGGFVELLAAQQTMDEGPDWYQGTADAVRKNLRYFEDPSIKYVLILSGDQLYRMDYREMIAAHERSGAEATLAGLPVSRDQAKSLGIIRVDDSGRVRGFVEKPQTPEAVEPVAMDAQWFRSRGMDVGQRDLIANMGVYLFNRDTLVELLATTDHEDFGKQIFPQTVDSHHLHIHLFDGYWEDIGTIRAFYEANLSLVRPDPPFEINSRSAPIYTRARFLPPARIRGATISDSLISEGCHVGQGATIVNSIVGPGCTIGDHAVIRDSILFGVDTRSGATLPRGPWPADAPPMGIGPGCVIQGVIVDRNAHIGRNVQLVNEARVQNSDDADDCVIRDGIPVVLKDAILPDGWQLNQSVREAAQDVSESKRVSRSSASAAR